MMLTIPMNAPKQKRLLKNIMQIEFEYKNSVCNYDSEIAHWGCCCTCTHRKPVNNHCFNKPDKTKCTCNESLGFYICTCFLEIDGVDSVPEVNICGEHGVCENFRHVESKLEWIEKVDILEELSQFEDVKQCKEALKITCFDIDKARLILKSYRRNEYEY